MNLFEVSLYEEKEKKFSLLIDEKPEIGAMTTD